MMLWQMWESTFHQTLQVLVPSDTQNIQCHCALWHYVISRHLSRLNVISGGLTNELSIRHLSVRVQYRPERGRQAGRWCGRGGCQEGAPCAWSWAACHGPVHSSCPPPPHPLAAGTDTNTSGYLHTNGQDCQHNASYITTFYQKKVKNHKNQEGNLFNILEGCWKAFFPSILSNKGSEVKGTSTVMQDLFKTVFHVQWGSPGWGSVLWWSERGSLGTGT